MNKFFGLALSGLIATGCAMGSATVRYQDQAGGVLVLEGDEGKAMENARKKMDQHCGMGNHAIVKRETVKVGSENYSNSNTAYDERTDRARDEDSAAVGGVDSVSGNDGYGNDYSSTRAGVASSTREDETTQTTGGESTSAVSGVRDVNEIRMHYQCGGAVAAPVAAPAPAPAPAPGPAPAPAPGGY